MCEASATGMSHPCARQRPARPAAQHSTAPTNREPTPHVQNTELADAP